MNYFEAEKIRQHAREVLRFNGWESTDRMDEVWVRGNKMITLFTNTFFTRLNGNSEITKIDLETLRAIV